MAHAWEDVTDPAEIAAAIEAIGEPPVVTVRVPDEYERWIHGCRAVTMNWFVPVLARQLNVPADSVISAASHLPTNYGLLLDTPEGVGIIGAAVAHLLGIENFDIVTAQH